MQLYDKDLLSMQEVRELVGAAKKAQQILATKSQEEVDRIVRSIANAGVRNARRLAQMAHEDTGSVSLMTRSSRMCSQAAAFMSISRT